MDTVTGIFLLFIVKSTKIGEVLSLILEMRLEHQDENIKEIAVEGGGVPLLVLAV